MQGNQTMRKLQTALNSKGEKILIDSNQFWSDEKKKQITMYHVKKAVWDIEKLKYSNIEIFRSCSQIQIILFLRDLWYKLNGQELPTDNEMWNEIREKIAAQD